MVVSVKAAPALGDIRALGPGDTVWLRADAPSRADWGRYLDAMGFAIARGADVRWIRNA